MVSYGSNWHYNFAWAKENEGVNFWYRRMRHLCTLVLGLKMTRKSFFGDKEIIAFWSSLDLQFHLFISLPRYSSGKEIKTHTKAAVDGSRGPLGRGGVGSYSAWGGSLPGTWDWELGGNYDFLTYNLMFTRITNMMWVKPNKGLKLWNFL